MPARWCAGRNDPPGAPCPAPVSTPTTPSAGRTAADYRLSVPLAAHADEIRERALAHGLGNIRVFGSAVRGEDGFDSDIDLVVTPSAGTDLFDLALFIREVEELTGFPTDAVSDAQVPAALADAVREAVPL